MNAFSINNRTTLAVLALVVVGILFAVTRMPGGIGGTGITGTPGGIGGTGIYGRIDAFGSIWVNGVEIFYDEDQNVVRQGRDGLPNRLAIGQMVAVTIDEQTGRGEAKTIEIIEEVVGPVETATEDQINMLGQVVLITEDTVIDLPSGSYEGIEKLAIGGYRTTDGEIIASHISEPLLDNEVALRGKIEQVERDSYWIEDQKVIHKNHRYVEGQHLEVSGKVEGGIQEAEVIVVENVKSRGALPFDQLPENIKYQSLLNFGGYHDELDTFSYTDDEGEPVQPNLVELREVLVLEASVIKNDVENTIVNDRSKIHFLRTLKASKASAILKERRNHKKEQNDFLRQDPISIKPKGVKVLQEVLSNQDIDRSEENTLSANENVVQKEIQGQFPRAVNSQALPARTRSQIVDEQRQRQIQERRAELAKRWLDGANVKRVAAVEARRQAIARAREQAQNAVQNELQNDARRDAQRAPQAAFSPNEVERLLKDSDIDRPAFERLQREIRDGVRRDLREGTREQLREEVRKRIRDEIRRRVRRQLREQ